MGGVGGEFALSAEPRIEPIERVVDGANQRQYLARHTGFGQSEVGMVGTDFFGQRRGSDNRLHRTSENEDVDDQQQQQDWRCYPAHMG